MRRHLLPLWIRIFAVNGLVLVILAASLLAMGGYQKRLIASDLDALAMQAKLVANALGESSIVIDEKNADVLSPLLARFIIKRLAEASGSQIRLFDSAKRLIADSEKEPEQPSRSPQALMRVFDVLDRLYDHNRWPIWIAPDSTQEPIDETHPLASSLAKGLEGHTDNRVWSTPQGGLLFTVALPVQRAHDVLGVVILARPDTRLDAAVFEIRLAIVRLFAVALVLTVLFSLYFTRTLAHPLQILAQAAEQVCHATNPTQSSPTTGKKAFLRHELIPDLSWRGDEIGNLSKALRAMTAALAERMRAIEAFAADVTHELKNPLTSLRSAVETARRLDNPERQLQLMAVIQDDVDRMNRLITDIAEASRLDAALARADIDVLNFGDLLRAVVAYYGRSTTTSESNDARFQLNISEDICKEGLYVRGIKNRLEQVLHNLLDNALSFSPPEQPIVIDVHANRNGIVVCICDRGPGIPPARVETIFERFYTERPRNEKFGTHSGLGLSIARQIVTAHNGTLVASNRTDDQSMIIGACFTIALPRTEPPQGRSFTPLA